MSHSAKYVYIYLCTYTVGRPYIYLLHILQSIHAMDLMNIMDICACIMHVINEAIHAGFGKIRFCKRMYKLAKFGNILLERN